MIGVRTVRFTSGERAQICTSGLLGLAAAGGDSMQETAQAAAHAGRLAAGHTKFCGGT